MAFASDSTRTPSTGGPVTRALYAMRREPEPTPTGRRLFLRAVAALPLVGAIMSATCKAEAGDLPEHEARFLALVPWFAEVVPLAETARSTASDLYDEGTRKAGEWSHDMSTATHASWWAVQQKVRQENGYFEAADLANDLETPIAEAFEPFRNMRMTTLTALA